MPLQDVLSKVPFLAGYEGSQELNRQRQMGDVQQATSLMALIQHAQQQQEGAKRAAMMDQYRAGLRPDMTPEEQVAHATRFTTDPKDVLHYAGQQLEAKARREDAKSMLQQRFEEQRSALQERLAAQAELAKQRSEDQRLTAQERNQARMDMIRLAASLRPAPQPQPLVSVVGENGQPTLATREAALGKTPWVGSPDQLALKVTGGRESVYVQRMMMGANQAAKDLANVVQIPLTATTGPFGGRKQGAGLLEAGKEILANTMTPQEAQTYNAMATGFQRSLAQIESAGLMPSGSLTHQMDAVLFKAGDTNLTKLHKLAQTRQIVEAGMETIEANPRVSPEEKAKVKSVLESVRKSVPFTHSDLIKLSVDQEKNPGANLSSVLGGKKVAPSAVDALLDKYK